MPEFHGGERPRRQEELLASLLDAGRFFYSRGWSFGTGGNFSVVLQQEPLRLAITPTGAPKETLTADQIVLIDSLGEKTGNGPYRPSSEASAHLALVKAAGAGAVLHTHSTAATILSGANARAGGLVLQGYEMLKGLEGVTDPQTREWIPILENTQDMKILSENIRQIFQQHPGLHGFLLEKHGLYTFGKNLEQARRHVEILEFLLEVKLKEKSWPS